MEKRRLGNSDMDITLVGFGAWAIGGGGWEYSWGPTDDEESIRAIRKAIDAGINWIDTAAVYGTGHSEELVASALEGLSNKPYIFTKCGLVWNEKRQIKGNIKRDSIIMEIDDSLRRLRMNCVDLYQIHWPDSPKDIEEAWEAMVEIKQQGKARFIGVSNFNVSQLERVQSIGPITSLQPPYSLLERSIEKDVLPYCQTNNIGVIVYSPMKSGLLSGKMTRERIAGFSADDWRCRSPDFAEPYLTRNLELVEELREIGAKHARTPGEVAIAWTLKHPGVTAAIVGARKAEQIDGIMGAASLKLSDEEVQRLEKFVSRT